MFHVKHFKEEIEIYCLELNIYIHDYPAKHLGGNIVGVKLGRTLQTNSGQKKIF